MQISFTKYHGTGNDFILIDNREKLLSRESTRLFAQLCHRNFGIGADGLMLLQNHPDFDFEMVYFNSDGNESSMCGNGGRCMVHFANTLGLISEKTSFIAIDGEHNATIHPDGQVSLGMNDVNRLWVDDNAYVMDTGSPHFVTFCNNVEALNVNERGREIRNGALYATEGINVNFVEIINDSIFVRTYERGVENETLSCGTGVVAAAIAFCVKKNRKGENHVAIKTKGGNLVVTLKCHEQNVFDSVVLKGPATSVFEGTFDTDAFQVN